MRFDVNDKRVLVTGASSGIGREIARALANAGARLAIVSRGRDALERVAEDIAGAGATRPVVLTADLSRRGEAARLAADAVRELGRVDVLVNNAGVGLGGTQWTVGDADIAREIMETNYWSPLALIQALVPDMRRRKRGVVVNVASLAADVPSVLMGHYASTKAAIAMATETLRAELKGSGVDALLVLPGPVDTRMLADAKEVPGAAKLIARTPRGRADVLGRMVLRAIERRRRSIVYPRSLVVARLFPAMARRVSFWMMSGTIDIDDGRVVQVGSSGDESARQARRKFESGERANETEDEANKAVTCDRSL